MTPRQNCRSCAAGNLQIVLDLGLQPLANNLLSRGDLAKPEPKFPLRLAVCDACDLLQIAETVPPVGLFGEYLYFSSFSDTMLRHAKSAAQRYAAEFQLGPDSLAVEIASNDGYLLKNFAGDGVPCLGIEPAENIARVAREAGVETLCEFFNQDLASRLAGEGRQADLILGNNVFAHAPGINDFVAGLKTLLKPDGRIVLEFPYAADFIAKCEFDTIYHEHVFYFALLPLIPLFERHGLQIVHVERLAIHGGSLRLFAAHQGRVPPDAAVDALAEEERSRGSFRGSAGDAFSRRAQAIRRELCDLVVGLNAAGHTLGAYGASAKGSTLLNYCWTEPPPLDFIADRSSAKHGRFSPGARIPIIPAEELARRRPDYTLLLTWNFAEEILEQQRAYRDGGGKFIVPVPEPTIL